ncbi:MAG: hypothetical protein HZC02_00245 [Candidatus Levybacteria bacterium]|nr:hypothetical protein [Candidatus Levybacteria bacterium]
MSTSTRKALRKKISEDPVFLRQSKAIQGVALPYFEQLAEVLADLMDKPVNLVNLLQAKVRCLDFLLDGDYVKDVVDAQPSGIIRSDLLISFVKDMRDSLKEMVDKIIADTQGFLDDLGVTEQEILLAPGAKLNGESKRRYLSGNFTIGDLVMSQPMAIIDNTPD